MLDQIIAKMEAFMARLEALATGAFVSKAELDSVNTKLEASKTELATSKANEQALQAKVDASADLTTKLDAANAALATATAQIGTLKAEAKTVADAARDLVAAQGIPAGQLPAASSKSTDKDAELAAVRADMARETDPAKKSALAIKARELRGHSDLFKK